MNRNEIFALARSLMTQHGIGHWGLRWINSKSFAGLCWTTFWHTDPSRSMGRIELSTAFFDVFSDYDIRDTILHEIAHALTPSPKQTSRTGRTRYIHHGADWKAKAKEIGCSGERCVRQGAAKPKSRYKGICPNGHESARHRMTWNAKHATSCGQCDPKTFNPKYMFDWYDNGVLIHSQTRSVTKPAVPVIIPATTGAAKYAADVSDWDQQAELIKKVLQGV